MNNQSGPIGVFDSGFGGLTILKELVQKFPQYDFLYFGDNARAPYGNRSFQTVYQYTLECVDYLFKKGCPLVIIACNTASAKALRSIQQIDLQRIGPDRKVLGVLRPTTEIANQFTKAGHLGILATTGTVRSESYLIEINKFFPEIKVYQQECPIWVPLIESGEYQDPKSHYFFKKYIDKLLAKSGMIDAIILGCTHYPLIKDIIKKFIGQHINIVEQGPIVSNSLKNYLEKHPEIETRISKNSSLRFISSETEENFFNSTFSHFWNVPNKEFFEYEHFSV
ncbi:MAG: glutamate racemase [Bacteroidia bacterium]|nr:glutamate racemase [Bacteroidia bacterium]